MRQKEHKEAAAGKRRLLREYRNTVKKARKGADSPAYFYFQIFFSAVILTVSFMLKGRSPRVFGYAKENYRRFFEKDTFRESAFSYNSFLEKMVREAQICYKKLTEVFAPYTGKGKADIFPGDVSTKKYRLKNKGVVPVTGYISSPYGVRQNPFKPSEKEFHTGIDIAAPKGSFIKAAFSGTVTAAGSSDTAGNYIRIQSENEIQTLYAHNQFLLVSEGERVLAGQVIATVGRTGLATGPHLHFEFIVDGVRYNPIYALPL